MLKILHLEEVERNIFSKDNSHALKYMQHQLKNVSYENMLDIYKLYFKERNNYIDKSNKSPVFLSIHGDTNIKT